MTTSLGYVTRDEVSAHLSLDNENTEPRSLGILSKLAMVLRESYVHVTLTLRDKMETKSRKMVSVGSAIRGSFFDSGASILRDTSRMSPLVSLKASPLSISLRARSITDRWD